MPIFFHSTGGMVGSGIGIGRLLRDRRMTVGIGQTIPQGCREAAKADEACRRLMRSGRELTARLRFENATCASACAYAFFGGSTRRIDRGTRIGVHASRVVALSGPVMSNRRNGRAAPQPNMSDGYNWLKRYALYMGVDASVIDLARQTGPHRMHWLSREEIRRLGILGDDVFETGWQSFDASGTGTAIIKSVSQRAQDGFLTTTIELGCASVGHVSFAVRRELQHDGEAPAYRVTSGPDVILDDNERTGATGKRNYRAKFLPGEIIRRAALSDLIVLQDTTGSARSEIRFSTKGLADALKAARGGCAEQS